MSEPRTLHRSAELKGAAIDACDLGGATVTGSDLRGVTIRESYLDGLRIVGSVLGRIEVSSFAGDPAQVVVEGVEVWQLVSDVLDERHPERVQLRAVRTADDHRAMWATVERLWEELYADAAQLPDDVRRVRVGDEWSLLETVRHLVFAVDGWLGRMLRGTERPFHPAGIPPTDFPTEHWTTIGLDPAADPTWEEAVEVLRGRQHDVRAELASLTDAQLTQSRSIAIAPPVWDVETETVAQCFTVMHREHVDHLRYARRDLATLLRAQDD